MILSQGLQFVALHAVPKSVLRKWLRKKLSRGPFAFEPQFSGRVSLFLLARRLLPSAQSDVALVPDYVCNIVPRAFRLAGWEIGTYPTGPDLEPDWEELLLLLDARKAGVLVGASVFGSSGLLTFLSEICEARGLAAPIGPSGDRHGSRCPAPEDAAYGRRGLRSRRPELQRQEFPGLHGRRDSDSGTGGRSARQTAFPGTDRHPLHAAAGQAL